MPPQDEDQLDGYEGVPRAYQKFQIELQWVRDSQGNKINDTVRTLVYLDPLRVEEHVPRKEYVGRLEKGIRDAVDNWGLDERYADRVMRRYWKN